MVAGGRESSLSQSEMGVLGTFSFYPLFLAAERVRWKVSDIDFSAVDKSKVEPDLIPIVKLAAMGELTTLSATHQFLSKFSDDLDFSQWICVWFYEESMHPFALMRWLAELGESFDESALLEGRKIHPMPSSKMEALCLNIIAENNASMMYGLLHRIAAEPVLQQIAKNLSGDEKRHAMGFLTFAKNTLNRSGAPNQEIFTALETLQLYLRMNVFHPVLKIKQAILSARGEHLKPLIESQEAELLQQIFSQFSRLVGCPIKSSADVAGLLQHFRQYE